MMGAGSRCVGFGWRVGLLNPTAMTLRKVLTASKEASPLAATRMTTVVLATSDGSSIFRRKMEAWKMTKRSRSTVPSTGGRQVKTSIFMLLCTEAPSWLAVR